MTRTTSLAVAFLLGLCPLAAPAQAQLARTWVSSLGNDNNDCNRLTPCKTFQAAHDKTLADGEISVLDPGGYGAVTITKGISIINDGSGEAGVLVSGGLIGITINAGLNDKVSLRGLTIKGIGFGGGNGIRFVSGKSLSVENCVIRNHTGDGFQFVSNVVGSARLIISNTLVSDNGGNGIWIQPSGSGELRTVLNRVEVYSNAAHGIAVLNSGTGIKSPLTIVTDSVSAFNGLSGIALDGNGGLTEVRRSVVSYNNVGLISLGHGALFFTVVYGSGVRNNVTGRQNPQGSVLSYGDNYFLNFDGDPGTMPLLFKK